MQTAQWQAVYLHGKGGNAREAEHYRALLPGWRVTGLDYRAPDPLGGPGGISGLFQSRPEGWNKGAGDCQQHRGVFRHAGVG